MGIMYFFNFILSEHHKISFRNYDITFLRGVISMMKNEYRGSGDIPKKMQYTEPKQPKNVDSKVKELYLYTASDFQHVQQLLTKKGREAVAVCMNICNLVL